MRKSAQKYFSVQKKFTFTLVLCIIRGFRFANSNKMSNFAFDF